MAIPILHAKAKEELFRFMKQLAGHYLLKENSSSAAGPTIFKCFPLLQEHSNWGKNSTAAINLIQKDLYLSLGLKVLYSFPRRFSLICVNSCSSTDTQSLPYHLIAWMTLVNQIKIKWAFRIHLGSAGLLHAKICYCLVSYMSGMEVIIKTWKG